MAVSVGLGVGAVVACVPAVVGVAMCGYTCQMTADIVRGNEEKMGLTKSAIAFAQKYRWQLSCLFAIGAVGCAMVACSSGYVSIMLAKAAWLKIGVPSLVVPFGTAVVGMLLVGGSLFRIHQSTATERNLAK